MSTIRLASLAASIAVVTLSSAVPLAAQTGQRAHARHVARDRAENVRDRREDRRDRREDVRDRREDVRDRREDRRDRRG